MPTPQLQPKNARPWKAKYKGKWYDVEGVDDQGAGNQNAYILKGIGPVDKIEDLDMTGLAASFKGVVMAKYLLLAAVVSGCATIAPYRIDDPKVLQMYNDMMEAIDIWGQLPMICRELQIIGRNISSLSFNERTGVWDSLVAIDPDQAVIQPVPARSSASPSKDFQKI